MRKTLLTAFTSSLLQVKLKRKGAAEAISNQNPNRMADFRKPTIRSTSPMPKFNETHDARTKTASVPTGAACVTLLPYTHHAVALKSSFN